MKDAKDQAVRTIKDEHRTISAVLHGLRYLAQQSLDAKVQPDFAVFRAMIYYIDEFPEKLHHPKEEKILFARLLQRMPEAAALIGELHEEHLAGARLIRELERELAYFEENRPAGAASFKAAVDAYADFHWNHMRKEEGKVLPLAGERLLPEDWEAISTAFAANKDPIAGVPEKEFETLFSRIASIAPDPIGFGSRWKKAPT
ncbi:MAG: hemerythrin domain-containing protein [Proteobacteria bacterium]|nr:hemerythrin domain-containing protein [Pseudomonadota bacterium]